MRNIDSFDPITRAPSPMTRSIRTPALGRCVHVPGCRRHRDASLRTRERRGLTTLLKRSAPFATTLQVSESRWPTTVRVSSVLDGRVRRRAHGRRHSRLFARSRFVGLPAAPLARLLDRVTDSSRRFSPGALSRELVWPGPRGISNALFESLLVRPWSTATYRSDREFP